MAKHELPIPGLEIAPDPLTKHAEFVAERQRRQTSATANYYPSSSSGGGGGPVPRKPSGGLAQLLKYVGTIAIILGGSVGSVLAAPTVAAMGTGIAVSFIAGIIFEVAVDQFIPD